LRNRRKATNRLIESGRLNDRMTAKQGYQIGQNLKIQFYGSSHPNFAEGSCMETRMSTYSGVKIPTLSTSALAVWAMGAVQAAGKGGINVSIM